MPRYERPAVETAGHRLRLYYPGRYYVGGDGREHVEHRAQCIRCGARARVFDWRRVTWADYRSVGGCPHAPEGGR